MSRMKFKTTMIAAAITFLFLLSFIGSSAAIEIESMYPSYGGYSDFTGSLITPLM